MFIQLITEYYSKQWRNNSWNMFSPLQLKEKRERFPSVWPVCQLQQALIHQRLLIRKCPTTGKNNPVSFDDSLLYVCRMWLWNSARTLAQHFFDLSLCCLVNFLPEGACVSRAGWQGEFGAMCVAVLLFASCVYAELIQQSRWLFWGGTAAEVFDRKHPCGIFSHE